MLVGILGPLIVGVGDPPARRQLRLLLAALALDHGRFVSTGELTELAWPGASGDRRKDLQIQMSRIRKLLGPHVDGDPLRHRDGAYLLDLGRSDLDVAAFEFHVGTGLATVDPGRRGAELRVALDLWRGDVVEDFPELAPHPSARRLDDRRLDALEAWARCAVDLDRATETFAELDEAIRDDPYREGLWAAKALGLARVGRSADALEACRRAAEVLRDDLGLDVGPELAGIELDVLRGRLGPARTERVRLAPPRRGPADDAPFVGRADVLDRLVRLVSDQREVVVVEGEAGAGKTRLLGELVDRLHAAGSAVVVGRASEAATAPLAPLSDAIAGLLARVDDRGSEVLAPTIDLIERLAPEVIGRPPEGHRLGAEVIAPQLAHALVPLVEVLGRSDGAVLVLDDVQWADATTLDVVARVRAGSATPLAVVLGLRRPGPPSRVADDAIVAIAGTARLHRIVVEALTADHVERYLEELAGHDLDRDGRDLAELLHRATGGNPLFLSEVVRHLVESGELVSTEGRWRPARPLRPGDVPRTVRDVVGSRLGRLGVDGRAVVEASATLGRPVSVDELGTVAGLGRGRAAHGARDAGLAGLLTEADAGLDLVHALVRDAVLDGLPADRRSMLHGRVAELARGSGSVDAAFEVLHHLEAAAPEDAVPLLHAARDAARVASGRRAHAEAADHLRIALRHAGSADTRTSVELEIELARAERLAGIGGYRDRALAAARRARHLDAPDLLLSAARAMRSTGWAGPVGQPDDEYDALLTEVLSHPDVTDPSVRAVTEAELAGSMLHTVAGGRRVELFRSALIDAERSGRDEVVCRVLRASMVLDDRDLLEEQRACVDRLIRSARDAGDLESLRHGHNIGIVAAFAAGDIGAIEHHRVELTRTAHALRDPAALWAEMTWRASVALLHGRLTQAEDLAEEAFGAGLAAGVHDSRAMAMYGGQLMELRRLQGRLGELRAVAETTRDDSQFTAWAYGAALVLAADRSLDERRLAVEALVAAGRPFDRGVAWASSLAVSVMLADDADRADLAAELHELALPWEDRLAFSGAASSGPLSLYAGRAARVAGRPDAAVPILRRARARARALAAPLSEAEAAIELAAALRQVRPADPEAERLLDSAIAISIERGAQGLVDRADAVASR